MISSLPGAAYAMMTLCYLCCVCSMVRHRELRNIAHYVVLGSAYALLTVHAFIETA